MYFYKNSKISNYDELTDWTDHQSCFCKWEFRAHYVLLFFANFMTYGTYKAFHGFGQAKFSDGGSVLGSSQFSILPQLPPKVLLNSKVVKINPKIIMSLHLSKSKEDIKHSYQIHHLVTYHQLPFGFTTSNKDMYISIT